MIYVLLLLFSSGVLDFGLMAVTHRQPPPWRDCPLPVKSYSIPSGSMEPTLHVGSIHWVACFDHASMLSQIPASAVTLPTLHPALRRGDVVVFRAPKQPDTSYVKRVIGLPGDRIAMVNNVVYLNGTPAELGPSPRPLPRDGSVPAAATRMVETLPGGTAHDILIDPESKRYGTMRERVILPETLFVLGDNRDNSFDSRMPDFGVLAVINLVGRWP